MRWAYPNRYAVSSLFHQSLERCPLAGQTPLQGPYAKTQFARRVAQRRAPPCQQSLQHALHFCRTAGTERPISSSLFSALDSRKPFVIVFLVAVGAGL